MKNIKEMKEQISTDEKQMQVILKTTKKEINKTVIYTGETPAVGLSNGQLYIGENTLDIKKEKEKSDSELIIPDGISESDAAFIKSMHAQFGFASVTYEKRENNNSSETSKAPDSESSFFTEKKKEKAKKTNEFSVSADPSSNLSNNKVVVNCGYKGGFYQMKQHGDKMHTYINGKLVKASKLHEDDMDEKNASENNKQKSF